jgi:hypothetical protein
LTAARLSHNRYENVATLDHLERFDREFVKAREPRAKERLEALASVVASCLGTASPLLPHDVLIDDL